MSMTTINYYNYRMTSIDILLGLSKKKIHKKQIHRVPDMSESHQSMLFIIMSIDRLLINSKQFIANIKSTYCPRIKQIETLTIQPEQKHLSARKKEIQERKVAN